MNMNSMCQVKQDILVVLDTRNCTTYYNGRDRSDVEWDLTDIISKPKKGVEFSVSVINASIPIGQYNISSETDSVILTFKETGQPEFPVTITCGNYTINTLLDALRSNTPSQYTYTYLAYRNKIFISNSTSNFTVKASTSLCEALGLNVGETLSSQSQTVICPNCVNMSGLRNINIHLDNVNTKNISSFTKSSSTIIASIPVDTNAGGVLSYNLSSDYEIPVPISNLDYINILLKNDLGQYILNNGIHWSLTLKFSYYIEQEFSTETLHEKVNKSKLSIIQPTSNQKVINRDIPKIFQSNEIKLVNE